MLKLLKITVILIFFAFIIFSLCYADDSVTITTYYPSPYGAYKELKLYPNDSQSTCSASNKGAMYYDDSESLIKVCNGGPSWQTLGGLQSGMIAMFDTSCPSGWTRFSALDNRVPRGSTTYGGTGGADTHTHPRGLGSLYYMGAGNDYLVAASSWPPYLNVIWCKKD